MLQKIKNKITPPLNDLILRLFGKRWKIILINEYPKCGASWLKMMLGDLLEEDGYFINRRPKHIPLIKPKYFIQRHWLKNSHYVFKTVIVLRDPRDAYNSYFYYENFYSSNPELNKLYRFDIDADEKQNMFNYLKNKLESPHLSNPGFSYKEFWNKFKDRNDICFVKYEDLKKKTKEEVARVIEYLGYNKNPGTIAKCVEKYTLANAKRIENETDERKKFVRKGIIGDWKNNFNTEAIELIKNNLADMLIEMNYEEDKNW